jgi:hypothetical protein
MASPVKLKAVPAKRGGCRFGSPSAIHFLPVVFPHKFSGLKQILIPSHSNSLSSFCSSRNLVLLFNFQLQAMGHLTLLAYLIGSNPENTIHTPEKLPYRQLTPKEASVDNDYLLTSFSWKRYWLFGGQEFNSLQRCKSLACFFQCRDSLFLFPALQSEAAVYSIVIHDQGIWAGSSNCNLRNFVYWGLK